MLFILIHDFLFKKYIFGNEFIKENLIIIYFKLIYSNIKYKFDETLKKWLIIKNDIKNIIDTIDFYYLFYYK